MAQGSFPLFPAKTATEWQATVSGWTALVSSQALREAEGLGKAPTWEGTRAQTESVIQPGEKAPHQSVPCSSMG